MIASEAAGLLRGAKLGHDAVIMAPHSHGSSMQTARRPPYSPEQGLPAVAALVRGKPVLIRHIEQRAAHIFRRDPLPTQLARLSPGRGLAASLHWAPPKARALFEHEDMYD